MYKELPKSTQLCCLATACGAQPGDLPPAASAYCSERAGGLHGSWRRGRDSGPSAQQLDLLGLPDSSGFLTAAEGAVAGVWQEAGVNKVQPWSRMQPGQDGSQAPQEVSETAVVAVGQAPSPVTAHELQQDLGMGEPCLAAFQH